MARAVERAVLQRAGFRPQGLCESRQLEDFDGQRYWVALISRRSSLHPGPRYKARGLNNFAEPANELEVEQVRSEGAVLGCRPKR
jgi:hypothetical protein